MAAIAARIAAQSCVRRSVPAFAAPVAGLCRKSAACPINTTAHSPAMFGPLSGARSMASLWDGMTSRMEGYRSNQQAKKSAEIFKAQIDYMRTLKVFKLSNFVEMMGDIKKQSGVEGWSKVLRTKEQQEQLEQVMVDVKVGEHFQPQELRNPTLVGRREKLRIASDAGVEVSAVNAFFKNYEQTVALHRWVQRRIKAEMPVPANMEEFVRMSSTDSSGLRPSAAGAPGKGRGRLGMAGQVGW